MAHVPDFPAPKRGGGDPKTPDAPAPSAGKGRGKYPKDAGGPPETHVGSAGRTGDPKQITAQTKTVVREQPRVSPVANTSTNPIK